MSLLTNIILSKTKLIYEMYLIILFLLDNLLLSCGLKNQTTCNTVRFRGKYYEKQKLIGSLNQPMNLVIHKSDHIFFKYMDWNNVNPDFHIKICNIKNGTCKKMKKSYVINTMAYDHIKNNVFLGGTGIFVYNFTTQEPQRRSVIRAIHHIFVHKDFYIIRNWTLYTFSKMGRFIKVPEVKDTSVKNFLFSTDLSIYFTNATGLFKVDTPGTPIYFLSGMQIQQMAEDYKNGGVYFATPDGIYMDITPWRKLKKVSTIKRAFGITFRYDNNGSQLIYSDNHAIYVLNATNQTTLC